MMQKRVKNEAKMRFPRIGFLNFYLESAGIASHRGASSANTATATLQAVPFDPARCPLSNGATATLPLPLSVPPCFIISLSTATAIFQKKKKKATQY
jgi:hypothetical protein